MKRTAVFFDRDNTLIVSDNYLGDPSQVRLVEGAAQAIAAIRQLGMSVVTFSNQSGVARGLFDERAVHHVNEKMDELLTDIDPGAVIDRHEYCPYHPQASVERYRQDSPLRKPRPGMLLQAAEALDLDLSACWVIGDTSRDIAAGQAAGCRTILFLAPTLKPSPAAAAAGPAPDYTVPTLNEAVLIIEKSLVPPADQPAHDVADPNVLKSAPTLAPSGGGATPSRPLPPMAPAALASAPAEPHNPPQAAAPDENNENNENDDKIEKNASSPILREIEKTAQRILRELEQRAAREAHAPHSDFSITKLLAGITQTLVLAILLLSYLRSDTNDVRNMLLLALTLQTMTISLLIMGRQK